MNVDLLFLKYLQHLRCSIRMLKDLREQQIQKWTYIETKMAHLQNVVHAKPMPSICRF